MDTGKRDDGEAPVVELQRGKAPDASALACLEKRPRENGCCIGTARVDAAEEILAARRCKQAGMHWRVANAACSCTLPARLRSAARP